MARHVSIDVTCDWPAGCDVRVPEGDERIVPKTLTIDGGKPREFLICKTHLEDFEEIVLPLMAAGVPVPEKKTGRSKKTDAPSTVGTGNDDSDTSVAVYDCKVEGCGRQIKKRTGMAQHVGPRGHGFESLAAYEAQYGTLATT